jgi:arsenate reductase
MTVTIYHNPSCGTSRTVLAMIRETGTEPKIIEYLKAPPTRNELSSLLVRMGLTPRDIIRRKGTLYAELGLADPALTDEQLLDALIAHPVLMERPIVVTDKGVRLGRPPAVVKDILPP